MRKTWTLLLAGLLVLGVMHSAFAGATPEEAKALVEKAEQYFQANGKEKALQEFNNPKGQFVQGELYIFAWDMNGTNIAHGVNPKQVGVNVLEIPDVDGKFFRKDGLEEVKKKGSAWVDYKFKNPKSGKVEAKTTYLKKAGDIVLGCGAYK